MTAEELTRVIEVNLLGQIYGMKAALPHLRRQAQGTIINVASALAERAVPLQAAYCASKHGVKGFTEALRLELEHERSGINITLVLPSSINTPFFAHARSRLGVKPMPIPPIYEPRVVAEALVFAAEHPRREIVVGGAGKALIAGERLSASLLDRYMLFRGQMFNKQKTSQPDDGQDNLYQPSQGSGASTGEFGQQSQGTSLYTRYLELHPARKRALVAVTALGALTLLRRVGR